MTAPSGSGKTVLARELLKENAYLEVSAAEGCFAPSPEAQEKDVLFIDDIQELLSAEEQQAVISYIRDNPKKRFVLASRGGVTPGWLLQFEFAGLVGSLTIEDFRFGKDDLRDYLSLSGQSLPEATLDSILNNNHGYPLAISTLARRLQTHGGFNEACEAEGRYDIYRFLDHAVLDRFQPELQSFCLELSLFDSFSTELARMVSGSSQASGLIEEVKLRTGFMISDSMDMHRFLPGAEAFFRWKLEQLYSREQIGEILSRAALFYELQDDFENAMRFYAQAGQTKKVSRLLEKNARRQVGMAHYPEL
ncbi:MAG: hypothetical protein HUJ80_06325, partial [Firmicutes bacterium]|nr:hypothetical protein [Bacillota bacterium]